MARLGAFITITNPEQRGDTYAECLKMATDVFDTVTIIDGKDTWPEEFDWPVIGEHFQRGYEKCDADWVFHLDVDFFFHQDNKRDLRIAIDNNDHAVALSFWKYQFVLPHSYNLKSRLVLAVNKKAYGDRIRFDSGGDGCQPSFDGKYINPSQVPEARIPFYNYEKIKKTKAQIMKDVGRMDRAWHRSKGEYLYSLDGTDKSAYDGWYRMIKGRYQKPQKQLMTEEHPWYIQQTIRNLTPEQFGYGGFGLSR